MADMSVSLWAKIYTAEKCSLINQSPSLIMICPLNCTKSFLLSLWLSTSKKANPTRFRGDCQRSEKKKSKHTTALKQENNFNAFPEINEWYGKQRYSSVHKVRALNITFAIFVRSFVLAVLTSVSLFCGMDEKMCNLLTSGFYTSFFSPNKLSWPHCK